MENPLITKEIVMHFLEHGFPYQNLPRLKGDFHTDPEIALFVLANSYSSVSWSSIHPKLMDNRMFVLKVLDNFENGIYPPEGIERFSCILTHCGIKSIAPYNLLKYDHGIIQRICKINRKCIRYFGHILHSKNKNILLSVNFENNNYTVTNIAGEVVSAFSLESIQMDSILRYIDEQYCKEKDLKLKNILLQFPTLPKLAIINSHGHKHEGKIGEIVKETKCRLKIKLSDSNETIQISKDNGYCTIYDM